MPSMRIDAGGQVMYFDVDGAKLGSMPGYEEDDEYSDSWYVAPERFYWINPGFREVEFRFGNDLQSRVSQGVHEFTNDALIELTASGTGHLEG